MTIFRLYALLAIAISLLAPAARAQEIATRVTGNAVEAIFHQVTGPFEPGFADRLAAHLDENAEGFRVRLDSPGGDLFEALAVGHLLREREMHTEVGGSVEDGYPDRMTDGECLSACAIAFLGGSVRHLDDPSALGFHRFYRPIDPDALPRDHAGDYDRALAEAQIVSGVVVAFMVEMGIDARVFTVGSTMGADEVIRFERAEAEALGIITPDTFGAWFIEPYDGGIVAASRRQAPTEPYSLVTQATLYCTGDPSRRLPGTSVIMLNAPGASWLSEDDLYGNSGVVLSWTPPAGSFTQRSLPRDRVSITSNDAGAKIRIRLSATEVKMIAEATAFSLSLDVPRVAGGYMFGGRMRPGAGAMLRAAATHCI